MSMEGDMRAAAQRGVGDQTRFYLLLGLRLEELLQ